MSALFLAAAAAPAADKGVLDRLAEVPLDLWIKIGVGLLALIAAILLIRTLAKFSGWILGFVVLLACTFIGFNWVYERSEPEWATPVVAWLAEFFPTKGRK
jgi:apolipoprotein N-acyltransferase